MDGIMSVPEIDKDFFEAIPNIKCGYQKMYPNAQFTGKIEYKKIVENRKKGEKVALFFSGGVDATTSLLRHIEETPMLITLWGSDVGYNNQEAWNIVDKGIEECSNQYKLPKRVIRTTFRDFDDEGNLSRFFIERLGDNWWHGIKHGMAIICHAAPLVWLYSLKMEKLRVLHIQQ